MVPVDSESKSKMADVASLQFCCEELTRRAALDSGDAWYWQMKQKIARFLFRQKERELSSSEQIDCPNLSDDEQSELLIRHPLLQFRDVRSIEPVETQSEWSEQIRLKVGRYLDSVSRNRENS